ncbi:hypothetical protein [Methylophilus sp.]|uniref:hypothetical protein n=1 Tax=Methylophilus sp. TaxID=29541 RepID=UPI000D3F8981|nr:hypothetical protein [Methylophilus sp.]PPD12155.1 MAG: hypothetical protein CTY26_06075 [Methylophilus sp.]
MSGWGEVGSAIDHQRYMMPVDPKRRRKCHCGCEKRATHRGMANGVCLITLFKFEDSAFIKKGQIGFLAWARSGGNMPDASAFKVYQHSAT